MRRDVYNEVQRQISNDIKVNCAEMARRFNCDPRTVKRYVDGASISRRTFKKHSVLDNYKEVVIDKIDNFGATAKAAYYFIKKRGYGGSYNTVKRFAKNYKQEQTKRATVRFETVPGLQAQVDWKEKFQLISKYGEIFEFNIFLYILGYSRSKYIEITLDKKQDTLFRCITNAFQYTDGIPQEIWFDNMTTVVDRPNTQAGNVKVNTRMQQYSKDMGFAINVCKAYRPQTKGKVEALAKLMDRLVVFNKEFENIDELIQIVREFNNDINSEVCQSTGKTPNYLHKIEKENLKRLPSCDIIESYVNSTIQRKVSKESMITYNQNKYSVPVKYIGETVTITPYAGTLKVYFNNEQIASHSISNKYLNYQQDHLAQIFKSDVYKYKSDDEIEAFTRQHLADLDLLLEANNR